MQKSGSVGDIAERGLVKNDDGEKRASAASSSVESASLKNGSGGRGAAAAPRREDRRPSHGGWTRGDEEGGRRGSDTGGHGGGEMGDTLSDTRDGGLALAMAAVGLDIRPDGTFSLTAGGEGGLASEKVPLLDSNWELEATRKALFFPEVESADKSSDRSEPKEPSTSSEPRTKNARSVSDDVPKASASSGAPKASSSDAAPSATPRGSNASSTSGGRQRSSSSVVKEPGLLEEAPEVSPPEPVQAAPPLPPTSLNATSEQPSTVPLSTSVFEMLAASEDTSATQKPPPSPRPEMPTNLLPDASATTTDLNASIRGGSNDDWATTANQKALQQWEKQDTGFVHLVPHHPNLHPDFHPSPNRRSPKLPLDPSLRDTSSTNARHSRKSLVEHVNHKAQVIPKNTKDFLKSHGPGGGAVVGANPQLRRSMVTHKLYEEMLEAGSPPKLLGSEERPGSEEWGPFYYYSLEDGKVGGSYWCSFARDSIIDEHCRITSSVNGHAVAPVLTIFM